MTLVPNHNSNSVKRYLNPEAQLQQFGVQGLEEFVVSENHWSLSLLETSDNKGCGPCLA